MAFTTEQPHKRAVLMKKSNRGEDNAAIHARKARPAGSIASKKLPACF
jgi:hypothetical protein